MTSLSKFSKIIFTALAGLAGGFVSGAGGPDSNIEHPPISQPAGGVIQLEARDVTIHGTTVRYEPQPHKNTIGYWTKVADWVSWDFQLNQAGRYKIEILQACGKGSGGSEFVLSLGGQNFTNTVVETGAFTNFITRAIGVADLSKAGPYTLAVKPVKKPGLAVMDLRMVTLSPFKDPAP